MRGIVLVTDGEQRAALALVRSLGRAGYTLHVAGARAGTPAGASRWCRSEAIVSDASADPAGFARDIETLAARLGATFLIPVTESALLALLPLKDRLHNVVIPFPDVVAFQRICDKALVLEHARALGISIPDQRTLAGPPRTAAELGDLAYPVVIKPSRSVAERNGRRVKLGVRHARDGAQLAQELAALDSAAFPVLLQQRVVGPGVGIFLLVWNGRVLARFAHRRLREKPPAGGVSVYRESIAADPELVALSTRLLESFDWHGVAMVEYKVDAATGTPYLMEINGRFWGSLQLAIDAGVDFPKLLLEAAAGGSPAPVLSYRTGIRSRWWWGDVDQLLLRLRRSPEALSLPPGEPGALRSLARFLVLWRPGDRNEILKWHDPRPFVRETLDWVRGR